MRLKCIAIAALAAGAVAVSASEALAAPVTVKTDKGTSCTIDASRTLGSGLLIRPISFAGTITCTLADPARAANVSGGLILTSTAPLGLGSAGGQPTSPEDQELRPGAKAGEFAYTCDLEPAADCGFAGRSTGLPLGTYQVIYGAGLTAPEGERWTVGVGQGQPNQGCEASQDEGRTVSCASSTEKFTTG